jgi:hypothetical protein
MKSRNGDGSIAGMLWADRVFADRRHPATAVLAGNDRRLKTAFIENNDRVVMRSVNATILQRSPLRDIWSPPSSTISLSPWILFSIPRTFSLAHACWMSIFSTL